MQQHPDILNRKRAGLLIVDIQEQIIVVGIEAHVCVQQTALDLNIRGLGSSK